jgi:hypothetical protein
MNSRIGAHGAAIITAGTVKGGDAIHDFSYAKKLGVGISSIDVHIPYSPEDGENYRKLILGAHEAGMKTLVCLDTDVGRALQNPTEYAKYIRSSLTGLTVTTKQGLVQIIRDVLLYREPNGHKPGEPPKLDAKLYARYQDLTVKILLDFDNFHVISGALAHGEQESTWDWAKIAFAPRNHRPDCYAITWLGQGFDHAVGIGVAADRLSEITREEPWMVAELGSPGVPLQENHLQARDMSLAASIAFAKGAESVICAPWMVDGDLDGFNEFGILVRPWMVDGDDKNGFPMPKQPTFDMMQKFIQTI